MMTATLYKTTADTKAIDKITGAAFFANYKDQNKANELYDRITAKVGKE